MRALVSALRGSRAWRGLPLILALLSGIGMPAPAATSVLHVSDAMDPRRRPLHLGWPTARAEAR